MTALNSYTTTFIAGHDVASGEFDLVVQNNLVASGSADLFIHGYSNGNSYADLYVCGKIDSSGELTTYIYGKDAADEDTPLFIKCGDDWGRSLGLFLCNKDDASGEIPLYIECTTPSLPINSYADLYVKCEPFELTNNISLYIENTGFSESIPLYIRGLGFRKGWYIYSDSIDLFINRINEVATIPLFCKAITGETNSYIDLVITGSEVSSDAIDLAMPAVCTGRTNSYISLHTYSSIPESGNIDLYTNGFDSIDSNIPLYCCHNGGLSNSYCVLYIRGANIANNDLTLCIPNTYDVYSDSLKLYTSGW